MRKIQVMSFEEVFCPKDGESIDASECTSCPFYKNRIEDLIVCLWEREKSEEWIKEQLELEKRGEGE